MNQRDIHLPIANAADLPSTELMVDVQSSVDTRKIAINRVGIKSIRHPVRVRGAADGAAGGPIQHTIATFAMSVRLSEDVKGTHMSRFVALIEDNIEQITVDTFFQ